MVEGCRIGRKAASILCAGLFFAALFVFLGAHRYSAYQETRAGATSIESAFPELENHLDAASRFPGHPLALGELGRIDLERALAENQFGSGEKREEFLVRARDALKEQIRKNPLDANSFYRLGIVYTLQSYPLMIYAERGWASMIRALELSPSDEFLNVNSLSVLLAQWDGLSPKTRDFVWRRLRDLMDFNPYFISKIGDLWSKNLQDPARLREILAQDPILWRRIKSALKID